MISREPAGPGRSGRGGDWIVEAIDTRSVPQPTRAAKISAACRQAARSQAAREHYTAALRVLAAVRPALLELPPDRIEKALRIIEPRLLPGAPAHASAQFILRCRAPRSFARWLRRHPELVAAIRQEVAP